MKKKIFCTSYITPESIQRYLDWFIYYERMFPDCELVAYNDGPLTVDFAYKVIDFPEHLGRKTLGLFPGWKRSFIQGIKDGCDMHIESDLYMFESTGEKCRRYLDEPGYHSAYCNKYHFMETAFQIINNDVVRTEIVNLLTDDIDDFAHVPEILLGGNLTPHFILQGIRYENDPNTIIKPEYDYLSQISYEDFKKKVEIG